MRARQVANYFGGLDPIYKPRILRSREELRNTLLAGTLPHVGIDLQFGSPTGTQAPRLSE